MFAHIHSDTEYFHFLSFIKSYYSYSVLDLQFIGFVTIKHSGDHRKETLLCLSPAVFVIKLVKN